LTGAISSVIFMQFSSDRQKAGGHRDPRYWSGQ
jgi:hypothetical protein